MTDPKPEVQDDARELFAGFQPFEAQFRPKDSPFFWTIKAPTMREENLMALWWENNKEASPMQVAIQELAVTFGGTNLPAPNSPNQEDPTAPDFVPGLEDDATIDEVAKYLGSIPSSVVQVMWLKLKEVAIHWGPSFR